MFRIGVGSAGDYGRLARFHYCAGRPATWAGVWCGWAGDELAGVVVLSWPVGLCAERHVYFGSGGWPLGEKLRWANANLRTISRVIVHPRYRALGLGGALVRRAMGECDRPWVEARAVMGAVHPLFERAGMVRVGGDVGRPAYFVGQGGKSEGGRDVGDHEAV